MSSPLGSLQSAAASAAHSLPFSGRWLFPSGSITPLASPPASAPTRQIVSPRPQLMQPYDSYNTRLGQGHPHPEHSSPYPDSGSQMVGPHSLAQHGAREREPRQRERTPPGMLLSSDCEHCGNRVSVEVPRWMTDAMDVGGRALHESVRLAPIEGGAGGGGAHQGGRHWREGVVSGAIGVAKAIKSSPIPPMFVACVKAVLGMMIYLDRRFELHQRLAAMAVVVLEGLIEIEREVGLLRKGGEGISVLFEAFVKGSIALAKTDPVATTYQSAPAPAFASYATSDPHPPTPQSAWPARSLPVSPYHRAPTPAQSAPLHTRSPYLEPQVVGYSADSEGESEDGPHFRLDDIDPRSPSHAAYPTPELLVPGAMALRRTSTQSLRRVAKSTPSLKEAARSGRRDASGGAGFPFPGSGAHDQLGASMWRGKQGRQRSRSEVSAGETLLERRDSGSGGVRSKVMSMTGLALEAERGWMGKFVVGAAERMGAM